MSDDTIDARMRDEIISKLIERLRDHYIYPDVALEMVQMVQQRQEADEYAHLTSGTEFCLLLTTQLQEVCHDKHLHVRYSLEPVDMQEPGADLEELSPRERERQYEMALHNNFGVMRSERLPGNVGYLDLHHFYRAMFVDACETMIAAIQQLVTTEALIIDLRHNGGGSPHMLSLLASYFFAHPIQLGSIQWRTGELQQYWTLPYVPGRRYLDKPLYLLLSPQTFSGAEAFAYDLKQLGRATLIGESTKGGAHLVKVWPLSEHVRAALPTGNALNPRTGTNWEGCGVTPDIQVPHEQALRVAHIAALKHLQNAINTYPAAIQSNLAEEVQVALAQYERGEEEVGCPR